MGSDGASEGNEATNSAKNNDFSPQKTGAFKWFKSLVPIDKFTFLVAIFTFFLVVIGFTQLWAFIQSERATIAIKQIKIDAFPANGSDPFEFTVSMKDAGKGSATILKSNTALVIIAATATLPDPPHYFGTDVSRRAVVASGDSYEESIFLKPTNAGGEPVPWNKDMAKAVAVGSNRFYVYGYLEYRDDFSLFNNRITGFCAVYSQNTPKTGVMTGCGADGYSYQKH
jgi:hypothetical protein